MTRILATGCGRAGTQYLAMLLSRLGLSVGNESVYTYDVPLNTDPFIVNQRWQDKQVEISWCALPWIVHVPKDCVIWHQFRNPLKVVRCWIEHRLLDAENHFIEPKSAITEFVWHLLPTTGQGSTLDRAVAYVRQWNEAIENQVKFTKLPYYQYGVEELREPEVLAELLNKSGFDLPMAQIYRAIEECPRNVGSCHHVSPELTWDMIPDTTEGSLLYAQAVRYGYA